MRRVAVTLIVVATGALAPAAAAHFRPRGFGRTYPVASVLCARVAAGQTPNRLASDAAQISAACTTLSNNYAQTVSTFDTAVAPIAAEVRSTLASLAADRRAAFLSHNWSAYKVALAQAISTFASLRGQEFAAAKAYVASIRSARRAFWTTVHGLAGASSLPSDSGTPSPPSSPTVPVLS